MKTKRGAAKRFSVSPNGRIKCGSAFRRHLLTKKSSKTKRQLRSASSVHSTDQSRVHLMMPYA